MGLQRPPPGTNTPHFFNLLRALAPTLPLCSIVALGEADVLPHGPWQNRDLNPSLGLHCGRAAWWVASVRGVQRQ